MNAKETYEITRRCGILAQYDEAQKSIQESREWNHFDCHPTHDPLFYEVALKLAEEGYDVKIVLREDITMSYTSVSWMNGWKNENVGTLQIINEAYGNYQQIANALGYGELVAGKIYVIIEGELSPQDNEIQKEEQTVKANNTDEAVEDGYTFEIPEKEPEEKMFYDVPEPPKSLWKKILTFFKA